MRSIKLIALCSIAVAVLVACGGGGNGDQSPKVKFSSMVTFGDSLSDVGTYAVGGIFAAGGGKWTVNSPTAKNWTELIAAQYGLPAPCAANTGMPNVGAMPLAMPAAVPAAQPAGCTNYAQGSSRVTSTAGPGAEGLWQTIYGVLGGSGNEPAATLTANAGAPQRYTALPIVSQMAQVTAYTGTELVAVVAGANDAFMQANAVGAVGAFEADNANTTKQGSAVIGATAAGLTGISYGAPGSGTVAQGKAVAAMAQAANELAVLVKAQVTKGAKHILVVNIPDISVTPFVAKAELTAPGTKALFAALVNQFNSTLQSALAGTPEVLFVDANTSNHDQYVNPSLYGLTNVTDKVCLDTGVSKAAIPADPNPLNRDANTSESRGSSIGCTAASSIAGDTSHYLFADGVHPTPYGYSLLAQLVTTNLIKAGWL